MVHSIDSLYSLFQQHPYVSIDSRNVQNGAIFFALQGERVDGNIYAKQALDNGASFVVISELHQTLDSTKYWLVADVLHTLQQLAAKHRDQFTIPFVAITGSNGKTTTKELVATALSSQKKCYATQGNYNNHIGVPLTILKVKPDADVAIIEMGANHQGEIAGYCAYTKPTHGLITNIGKAHLEGFGGEQGVKIGKGELFGYLQKTNGVAFVNTADANVKDLAQYIKKQKSYGTAVGNYTGAGFIQNNYLEVNNISGIAPIQTIQTKLAGVYNTINVLAAIAVADTLGINPQHIKQSIENYMPTNNRSQIEKQGTNTLILDYYNANPSSMEAAIKNFGALNEPKKVVILGAMKELGEESHNAHQEIISQLETYNWEAVALIGSEFAPVPQNYAYFNTAAEAGEWYQQQNFQNSYILIKGSNSMHMEDVLNG